MPFKVFYNKVITDSNWYQEDNKQKQFKKISINNKIIAIVITKKIKYKSINHQTFIVGKQVNLIARTIH